MTFTTAQTDLETMIGDTTNLSFTDAELQRALTEAYNDAYVVDKVVDTTLTFDTSTWQYNVPAALTTVQKIQIKRTTSDFPEDIPSDFYKEVDGKIEFTPTAKYTIPQGATLYIHGNKKLTVSDTITEVGLTEYILNLAAFKLLKQLAYKKLFKFLKNDTTMAEIIGVRREIEREIQQYRLRMKREWESA